MVRETVLQLLHSQKKDDKYNARAKVLTCCFYINVVQKLEQHNLRVSVPCNQRSSKGHFLDLHVREAYVGARRSAPSFQIGITNWRAVKMDFSFSEIGK